MLRVPDILRKAISVAVFIKASISTRLVTVFMLFMGDVLVVTLKFPIPQKQSKPM